MTFYTYLMKYKNEDSPKGDLAQDVHSDGDNRVFKNSNFKAKNLMRSYLVSRGACSECLSTFDECYEEYQEYVRGHRRK